MNAAEAVREGNERLRAGDAAGALEAYKQAEQLAPDAREIAFVEGLAHYDLKQFDQAREAFLKAAAETNDALADDALYSLGACDHAEALEKPDDPQAAVALLERAMRQYHQVLANRPDHKEARDANFKAASLWKELKQQLRKQPQQSQDQDQNKENDRKRQDQQPQAQNQPSDDKKQSQQQPDDQQQSEQKKKEGSVSARKQRVSRQQAERKLREMMQALRERKKARREPVRRIPVRPVDKDW